MRWLLSACVLVLGLSSLATSVVSAGDQAPVLCPPEGTPEYMPYVATQEVSKADAALPYRLVVPGLAYDVASPQPSPSFLALETQLAETLQRAEQTGRFAVAVTDLQTGATVGVGLDRVQLSGCVMNLFVLIATLRDVDAGRYPLTHVDSTIRQTIWASDATAARSLYGTVGDGDVATGVRVVANLLAELGMTSSTIDHPPAFPEDSIGTGPDNLVSARDVNHALYLLYSGRALSPESTTYLLDAMTQVKPGLNYLAGVVPPPAVVSHKNGFFWTAEGWVDNDASIVRFGPGHGSAYALTFLSEAVPTLYDDIALAQRWVLQAWAYFRDAGAAYE